MEDFVTYTKSPKHEVRDIPGMGKGVFTTQDIRAGEPIFSERPLLVMPRNSIMGTTVPLHYSIDNFRKVIMFESEKKLEYCLQRMSKERKAAFLSLANSHTEDGSGLLIGIVRTNGCQPNVSYAFFLDSFSIQFSANRPIKAGEQLFSGYCPIAASKAARNKSLEPYDFQCQCPACPDATPASDRFRTEYSAQAAALNKMSKLWVTSNTMSPDNPNSNPENTFKSLEMKPVFQFMEKLEKEGLQGTKAYAMMNMTLYLGYSCLGRRSGEGRHAELGLLYRWCVRAKQGSGCEEDYEAVAEEFG